MFPYTVSDKPNIFIFIKSDKWMTWRAYTSSTLIGNLILWGEMSKISPKTKPTKVGFVLFQNKKALSLMFFSQNFSDG
jgi:hypothetical protein